jgi:phytoene synthase
VRLPGGAGLISTALAIVEAELKARNRDAWLACLWAPAPARPGLIALLALEAELAQLLATTTEAMLGEIRLAWWRDRLLGLDAGQLPAQPLLQALHQHVLPLVSGAELAGLEDRWLPMLEAADVPAGFVDGGAALFGMAARLLGGDAEAGAALGRAWALGEAPPATAPPLRPLAGLAALAARDAARARAGLPQEVRGSLPRQWRLLQMMLWGR